MTFSVEAVEALSSQRDNPEIVSKVAICLQPVPLQGGPRLLYLLYGSQHKRGCGRLAITCAGSEGPVSRGKKFPFAKTGEIIPTMKNCILGTEKTSCFSLHLHFIILSTNK